MLTIKQDAGHLTIRSICSKGALAVFDRNAGTASVFSLAFVIPYQRAQTPLSELMPSQVFKREHHDGSTSYGVVLRYRTRQDIRFDCPSRDMAMDVMRDINTFLDTDK